jgi:hypothetical protein
MKKFGAIALSAAILSAMAVSASAAYIPQQDDPSTIQFTINQGYTAWAADGVISDGEYAMENLMQAKPQLLAQLRWGSEYPFRNCETTKAILQGKI